MCRAARCGAAGARDPRRRARGAARAGAAMPSTRALSAQLGVSRGVVVEAYAQLVAEGYLSARQGAATTVAARRHRALACEPAGRGNRGGPPGRRAAPAARPAAAAPAAHSSAQRAPAAGDPGWRVDDIRGRRARRIPEAPRPPRYDFRYGTPDLSAFPRAAWLAAGARRCAACPMPGSATATGAVRSSCAPRSPATSGARAASSPIPS